MYFLQFKSMKNFILLIPFLLLTFNVAGGELPVIKINIEKKVSVISKHKYSEGKIKVISHGEELLMSNIKIKGRGYSTWQFPKKPYQIKFEKKESVLGMPKDKKWILLANYSDKTMLRNEVAFDLSRMSNLDWTPQSRFIELFINDTYLGVYQITQKVEESSNRVKIGDDGYLLEVDQKKRLDGNDVYFNTEKHLFSIKEPKLKFLDSKFNLIKEYITKVDSIIMDENFRDPIEGYAKYIDLDSFIDWYIINELTKNQDAKFYSSVYMNYMPGKKLKMGPIWDFDISLGNINLNNNKSPEGFWIKRAVWYRQLFSDPNFVKKVKLRFNYFYAARPTIYEKLDTNVLYLAKAQESNFEKWPILGQYVWPNNVAFPTYEEEVYYLKDWLEKRFEWLKTEIDGL